MASSEEIRISPQEREIFSKISGDYNPYHLDALYSRKSIFGKPVVYGVLIVLKALEQHFLHLCAEVDAPGLILQKISANFLRPAFFEECLSLEILSKNPHELTLRIFSDSRKIKIANAKATFQEDASLSGQAKFKRISENTPQEPADWELKELEGHTGRIEIETLDSLITELFPELTRRLGPDRIAAVSRLSALVGMHCPGRHALFAGFSLDCDHDDSEQAICYSVEKTDERYSHLSLKLDGGPFRGTVTSFIQPKPVDTMAIDSIAALVKKDEFMDRAAVVLGGSRGLGAVAAKIIAAGGGSVLVTYLVGRAEAMEVARDIREFGGKCAIDQFQVGASADFSLPEKFQPPTDLLYFASPHISRRKDVLFSRELFNEFADVYVDGFLNAYEACRAMTDKPLTVFLPSSVFVETAPTELAEYSAAKAAAEVAARAICADDKNTLLVIRRLPMLRTDQTLNIQGTESGDPLKAILDMLRGK
jgi:acyl dehydratase